MKKQEFLDELRNRLQGLPPDDLNDRISFYGEMIDDRMDEGKSEEEAVADIGTVDDIVNEIVKDTPLVKLVKEKIKPKRKLKAWEIVLLILGFPLWFPLVLTALILCLVAYLLIWILVIVCYVVELSLSVAATAAPVLMIVQAVNGGPVVVYLGLWLMCLGGAILLFLGCIGATKLTLKLSKKIITSIKKAFVKKGDK